ncbi:hypothetical protein OPV22_027577 [Ensete ventricosum]|uniref:Uncharacterized protein n=1 Tax=Ensete ventricosum TaxID=4639 RepID=A0AAV8Q085_ENSVE|nr:hypothetical protein OPV22_027577 [Ensete ventricosum]
MPQASMGDQRTCQIAQGDYRREQGLKIHSPIPSADLFGHSTADPGLVVTAADIINHISFQGLCLFRNVLEVFCKLCSHL